MTAPGWLSAHAAAFRTLRRQRLNVGEVARVCWQGREYAFLGADTNGVSASNDAARELFVGVSAAARRGVVPAALPLLIRLSGVLYLEGVNRFVFRHPLTQEILDRVPPDLPGAVAATHEAVGDVAAWEVLADGLAPIGVTIARPPWAGGAVGLVLQWGACGVTAHP